MQSILDIEFTHDERILKPLEICKLVEGYDNTTNQGMGPIMFYQVNGIHCGIGSVGFGKFYEEVIQSI